MRKRTRTLAVGLVLACLLPIVATASQPPVAHISAYRSGATTTVTLDGSVSTDPDGQVVTFQWVFGDGTTGSGSPVAHSYPQPSSYTVTLLVRDNAGDTSFATQTIDVASLPSQAGTAAGATTTTAPATAAAQAPTGDDIGFRAPEIALPSPSGGMVHLSAYLGRPVLVEFWLSTCPGCRASTPGLEELRKSYAAQGLVVMLVILDRSAAAATTYLNQYGFHDFVLAWESDASKPTMTAYGVAVTPTAFLIDRTGVIRYAGHPSGLSEEFLKRYL
jgi:peroxiredoxin